MTEARPRGVTLGVAVGLCITAAGVAIGMRPLADNSYFTHLATGRLILESGSVPSHDPYTYTAQGTPWVVQSWLASVLYAGTERLAGGGGLRILSGVLCGTMAALLWILARPAKAMLPRVALVVLAVGVGAELWGERPLMFGLIGLALVILAAEDERFPLPALIPVAWVWVNTHGSFPLGVVYLVVAAVGSRLDGRSWARELACLRWLVLGILLGAVSPVGPKLLVFPLELLQKQDLLKYVIEWRSPDFQGVSQRLFLLQLILAIVLLARRPSYRSALLLAVFTAAALLGSRNVTVASLVALPAMAAAVPDLGSLRREARGMVSRTIAAAGAAVLALVVVGRLGQPDFSFGGYPVDAIAYLAANHVDLEEHHLAHQDTVGNYLELIGGPGRRVFYDDRFDMFPDDVSAAHISLVQVRPDLEEQLDRYDVELVVWARSAALSQRLLVDPAWRALYQDEDWLLVCRRGAELGGTAGRC